MNLALVSGVGSITQANGRGKPKRKSRCNPPNSIQVPDFIGGGLDWVSCSLPTLKERSGIELAMLTHWSIPVSVQTILAPATAGRGGEKQRKTDVRTRSIDGPGLSCDCQLIPTEQRAKLDRPLLSPPGEPLLFFLWRERSSAHAQPARARWQNLGAGTNLTAEQLILLLNLADLRSSALVGASKLTGACVHARARSVLRPCTFCWTAERSCTRSRCRTVPFSPVPTFRLSL